MDRREINGTMNSMKLSVIGALLILVPWSSMGSFDVPPLTARPAVEAEACPDISIRWNNPLHQFPILGFHQAVDMEQSPLDQSASMI